MFTLGGGSFGLQLGGKATDVVFVVMNAAGAKKLVQDSVKLGGEVSAAAGPVGRSSEGATDAQLHAEILSYSRTRGLFAGASLDGSVLKQDEDDNRRLYGHRVSAKELLILNGGKKGSHFSVEREPAVRLRDGFNGGREEMAEKVSSCFLTSGRSGFCWGRDRTYL